MCMFPHRMRNPTLSTCVLTFLSKLSTVVALSLRDLFRTLHVCITGEWDEYIVGIAQHTFILKKFNMH